VNWRATEYEDLHRIVMKEDPLDVDVMSRMPDTEQVREMLRLNAYSWVEDDTVIAIAGISPMWKGVGTVWTLISEEARSRGVALTKGIHWFLDMLRRDRGYWRIQATVERGDDRARRWIIHLGFVYEGTMVAYSPTGKTHDMYARVRG